LEIVINTCPGGYGLSRQAILRYAELSGFELHPVKLDSYDLQTVLAVPDTAPLEPISILHPVYWLRKPFAIGEKITDNTDFFWPSEIERADPILVRVVRELGETANGECARLKIVEIPDGVEFEIEESETGAETIHEKHRTWS